MSRKKLFSIGIYENDRNSQKDRFQQAQMDTAKGLSIMRNVAERALLAAISKQGLFPH